MAARPLSGSRAGLLAQPFEVETAHREDLEPAVDRPVFHARMSLQEVLDEDRGE